MPVQNASIPTDSVRKLKWFASNECDLLHQNNAVVFSKLALLLLNVPALMNVYKPRESIGKFVVTLVSRKNCCVASCETEDLLCYFAWVMNFKLV